MISETIYVESTARLLVVVKARQLSITMWNILYIFNILLGREAHLTASCVVYCIFFYLLVGKLVFVCMYVFPSQRRQK